MKQIIDEMFKMYNDTITKINEVNRTQNKVLSELAKKVHELEKQVMILAPGVFLELKDDKKRTHK